VPGSSCPGMLEFMCAVARGCWCAGVLICCYARLLVCWLRVFVVVRGVRCLLLVCVRCVLDSWIAGVLGCWSTRVLLCWVSVMLCGACCGVWPLLSGVICCALLRFNVRCVLLRHVWSDVCVVSCAIVGNVWYTVPLDMTRWCNERCWVVPCVL
jgi:hypothetical protein